MCQINFISGVRRGKQLKIVVVIGSRKFKKYTREPIKILAITF